MLSTVRFAWLVFKHARWQTKLAETPGFGQAFARGDLPWKPGDTVRQLALNRDALRLVLSVYGDECNDAMRDAGERAVEHMAAALAALCEMYEADGLPIEVS